MGLRPRLSADAAFAAYWNSGLAPGGLSQKFPSHGSVVILGRAAPEGPTPWRHVLPPPTRLNSNAELSMGSRPRLSADAAFAAYWNSGLAPGGLSFKNPVPRQCCDFRESGEAAVSLAHPAKRCLQAFLIKQRSCGST